MEKIHGLIDAPFTPFYENGEVNYEPIEAYCQLLVRNGLQGVFINGSSGEGYMLTEDERMKLAERWMEVAPEGFKVIVHVGSTCVKSSKRLAEHAQKIGAWGLVRITEYEVGLINYLYLVSKAYQINSVKRKCEKSPDLDEENYAIK